MSTEISSVLSAAHTYWKAGLTPIPHVAGVNFPSYLDADGCIQPIAWGHYKNRPPDRDTLERWFRYGTLDTVRIEILTGSHPVEKFDAPAPLQILDFESAAVFEAFLEAVHFSGHSDALYRCTVERTPSGGAHVGFRCTAISAKPKLNLAMTKGEDGRDTVLIELLQHHLCTVAPTRVRWKPERPDGSCYRLTQGTWAEPRTISPAQRNILMETCAHFNEVPTKVIEWHPPGPTTGQRPGDLLREQADLAWWSDLLTRHGWRDLSSPGMRAHGVAAFRRPGKVGKHCSATYGHTGSYLYVFSSNADPFDGDTAYSPFNAYALLEHGGDYKAAASALAKAFGLDTTPHRQQDAPGTKALKAVLSWGQRDPWTTPNALNYPPDFVDPWLGKRQTWCGVPGTGQGGAHE
jgi:putative DNA primase/helicase